MEPIHASGNILADDYVATTLHDRRVSPVVWVLYGCLTALVVSSGVIRALGLHASPDTTLITFTGWMPFYPALRRASLQFRARRICAETRASADVVEFSFSDEGLLARFPRGSVHFPWSDFCKWRSGREHFLLYLNSAHYLTVPKRLFADSAAVSVVEEKLRAAVGKAG